MATVTSLTKDRILELAAGWDDVSSRQDAVDTTVADFYSTIQDMQTSVEYLNNITLPNLSTTLTNNDNTLSDLQDNTLPELQSKFPITETDISDGAVTTNKIFTHAVTTEHLAAESVTSVEIAAETIVSKNIAAEQITTELLAAEAVVAAKIKAHEITGDHLNADVILATTRIAALGSAGQSVELNPDGFFVYGPTQADNSRPAYISFPTAGGTAGKPNIISGTLQATTLSVAGDPVTGQAATFRANNVMEQGATLTLNNAIVAPIAAPSASALAYTTGVPGAASVLGDISGVAYHAGQNALYAVSGALENSQGVNRIYKITTPDGLVPTMSYQRTVALTGRTTVVATGLTYVGGSFYVSYLDYLTTEVLIAKYDGTTWAQMASISLGNLDAGEWSTIGNDGTDVWVVDYAPPTSSPKVRFRRYLAALSSNVAAETVNTTDNFVTTNNPIVSLNVGNFDFGARKFVITSVDNNTTSQTASMNVWATTGGSQELSSAFPLMKTTGQQYLFWMGASNNTPTGYFQAFSLSAKRGVINRYTKLKLSATFGTATWWVGYSFYRSSDGAETTLSNMQAFDMKSRWGWQTTIVTPPSNLSARVYLSTASAVASTAKLQAFLPNSTQSLLLDTNNTSGAAPPAANTFGVGNPAILQTQATITKTLNISTANGSAVVTSTAFKSYMVGRVLAATAGFGAGGGAGSVTILSVVDGVSATVSQNATALTTNVPATIVVPQLEIRGDGYARITELESVILSSETDANFNSGNKPPLRVGNINAKHLRIDGDEIVSMASDNSRSGALLTLSADNIAFNLVNGGGQMAGGANFNLKLRVTADNTTAITMDSSKIVASTSQWVGGTPSASNTVPFHALDIHSWSGGIFMEDLAAASGTTATINLNGRIVRTSSSERFKEQIRPLSLEEAALALDLESVSFVWKPEMEMGDARTMGFIAEQAQSVGLGMLVTHDKDGTVQGFKYPELTSAILVLLKDAFRRIELLEQN